MRFAMKLVYAGFGQASRIAETLSKAQAGRTIHMLMEVPGQADLNATRVLSLDSAGRILDWISWQEAVCLYVRDAVAWTLGDPCLTVHGGMNRLLGVQSLMELHPIIASTGRCRDHAVDPAPALTNTALFARDRHLCLYCGDHFSRGELTRDHVLPISKHGKDNWENVVSACLACNLKKSNRTPQQANMPLLAVPYRPSWVEHLILSNRNILADQMDFLVSHLPRNRRTHAA
jgi:5-methylcytosine-specific restriction endonuclease McrA